MTKPDPTLAQIAAQFTRHDVKKQRRRLHNSRPPHLEPCCTAASIPGADRFELFYRSNVNGRWRTFGNLGRMKLILESAHEIVDNDPMFRIPRSR